MAFSQNYRLSEYPDSVTTLNDSSLFDVSRYNNPSSFTSAKMRALRIPPYILKGWTFDSDSNFYPVTVRNLGLSTNRVDTIWSNVHGIGLSNPSEKLDVNGNVKGDSAKFSHYGGRSDFEMGEPGDDITISADTIKGDVIINSKRILFNSANETDILSDANSGAYIQFNAYGENDVSITSDSGGFTVGGAAFIGNTEAALYFDGSSIVGANATSTWADNPTSGTSARLTLNQIGIRLDDGSAGASGILFGNNSASGVTSANNANKAILIGSQNSTINTGVTNSVIVGGIGITATLDNSLYTQNFIASDNITCDTIFSDAINIYSVSGTIDSTAISTLNGTPVQIVAAPGAGKAIEVINWSNQAINRAGLTAWATNTKLILITNTADYHQILDQVVLKSTATRITRGVTAIPSVTSFTQLVENEPLMINVATGETDTGNFDIKYYVIYRKITL